MILYLKTQSSFFKSSACATGPAFRSYSPDFSQANPVGQAETWQPWGRIIIGQRNFKWCVLLGSVAMTQFKEKCALFWLVPPYSPGLQRLQPIMSLWRYIFMGVTHSAKERALQCASVIYLILSGLNLHKSHAICNGYCHIQQVKYVVQSPT